MLLTERANDTNENTIPDRSILAIFYEEISKDPREALRITALSCQEQQLPVEEVLTRLLASAGAAPMNRIVEIHSMESKTITPIWIRFQINICPFGDNCKYRHIEDPNFTPRDNKENRYNNGADKRKFTPKMPHKYVRPPRGKSLDEQAPTYSTMQIRTLKLLANLNTENKSDDNNKVIVENNVLTTRDNNSWMFDNNSSTSTNSQARICTFNYSSSSSSSSSSTSTSYAPTYEQRNAHIWSRKLFNVMISQQRKKSVWISDVRLLHIQSLSFELICS